MILRILLLYIIIVHGVPPLCCAAELQPNPDAQFHEFLAEATKSYGLDDLTYKEKWSKWTGFEK